MSCHYTMKPSRYGAFLCAFAHKLPRVFRVSLLLGSILGVYAESVEQPPTPSWLAGQRELLPPVDPAAIEFMRDFLPKIGIDGNTGPTKEKLKQIRTIWEFGDQIEMALIWLYAEDPPPPRKSGGAGLRDLRELRFSPIDWLSADRESSVWLVPLVRARTDWAKKLYTEGKLEDSSFSWRELMDIQSVFTHFGTVEDIDNVLKFQEDIRLSGKAFANRLDPVTPEMRNDLLRDHRIAASQPSERFHERGHEYDKYIGPVQLKAAAQAENGDASTNQSKPHATSIRESQTAAMPQPESKSWLMWLFITIAAAAGAAWLLLRKSKP